MLYTSVHCSYFITALATLH